MLQVLEQRGERGTLENLINIVCYISVIMLGSVLIFCYGLNHILYVITLTANWHYVGFYDKQDFKPCQLLNTDQVLMIKYCSVSINDIRSGRDYLFGNRV